MKLISVSIDNFGKLSHIDMNFDDKCNNILKENGWGKSTLAAFIRIMFFGFDGEKKRDNLISERQRYKPWQGDTYGGKIVFETEGKMYEISRVFGTKEKDDVFEIRDLATNMISNDYSSNVGEELFGINSDSFKRTVFISQNDCVTYSTGDINAKLGNLSDATDDINNFETVNAKLADMLNGMSPRRKTGSLSKMKADLEDLSVKLKEKNNIEKSVDSINILKDNEKVQLEEALNEKKDLLEKKKEISKNNEFKIKRDTISTLKKEITDRENAKNNIEAVFEKEIPDMDELDKSIEKSVMLKQIKNDVLSNELNDEEKEKLSVIERKYENGMPKKYEVAEMMDECKLLKEIDLKIAKDTLSESDEEKLFEYKEKYGDNFIAKDDIDEYIAMANNIRKNESERKVLQNKVDALKEFNDRQKEIKDRYKKNGDYNQNGGNTKKNGKVAAILIVFAIILLALGLMMLVGKVSDNNIISIGIMAFGVLTLLAGVILLTKKSNSHSSVEEDTADESEYLYITNENGYSGSGNEDEYLDITGKNEYLNFKEELEVLSKDIERDKDILCRFLARIGKTFNDSDEIVAILYDTKAEMTEYQRLYEKKNSNDTVSKVEMRKEIEDKIRKFVYKYGYADINDDKDYQKMLVEIKDDMYEYETIISKSNKYDDLYNKYTVLEESLKKYVESITICGKDTEIYDCLVDIKKNLSIYNSSVNELARAREKYSEYMKDISEKDMEIIENLSDDDGTMGDIDTLFDECMDRINNIHNRVAEYDRQLDKYYEQLDEISANEIDYADMKEKYEKTNIKYKRIALTKELLEEAKNNMTAKYMEPLQNGFSKYYKLLAGVDADNYQLDVNSNITVNEKGMRRDVKFLSAGYKDLIYICMRMAFIDVMYEKQKPFIVFDDPFVNLDDEKTKYAMGFMKELEKEYQIIYFTCNNSRSEV